MDFLDPLANSPFLGSVGNRGAGGVYVPRRPPTTHQDIVGAAEVSHPHLRCPGLRYDLVPQIRLYFLSILTGDYSPWWSPPSSLTYRDICKIIRTSIS